MPIKLNGATSGSVELDVPAAVGSDLQLTLPATAGEVIVKEADGSVDLGSVEIDSSGRLLVGTSSTSGNNRLQVHGNATGQSGIIGLSVAITTPAASSGLGIISFESSAQSRVASITAIRDGGTWTNGTSQPSALVFSTTVDGASSPTERMRIDRSGNLFCDGVYNATTASAANVRVGSNGQLERSTSSAKYKTSIETLEDSYADALLQCRPVWYRSTCDADCPEHSWWGFIAEEVAKIDPRLVQWKTVEVTYDEKGSVVATPCTPEPEGVQYDRFVPHLLNLIKRQQQAIETLEAKVTALEAAE